MLPIRLLRSNEWEKWDQFVISHPNASIYCTAAWKDLVQAIYHHEPRYLVLEKEDGSFGAGFPLFIIKSRLSGSRLSALPCAPSADSLVSQPEELDLLLNAAIDMQKDTGVGYLEVKAAAAVDLFRAQAIPPIEQHVTSFLNIDRPEKEIFASFNKKCIQRHIEKSHSGELTLAIADTLEDVDAFYTLYLKMRTRKGLLPQPRSFFHKMYNIFHPQGRIHILLAKKEKHVVAAIVLLNFRDSAIDEYAASLPEFLHLSPNHFLVWEAILLAKKMGLKTFDFGRTALDNTGLLQFKRRLGTIENPLHYYYYPKASSYASLKQTSGLKSLMNTTIRHSPLFFGEMLGRALYRHLV